MRKYFIILFMMSLLFLSINEVRSEEIAICSFEFTSGNDKDGAIKIKNNIKYNIVFTKEKDLGLKIINNEKFPVLIIPNEQGGITFLDITPSGGFINTVVDSKGNAVENVNIILDGRLISAQFYGTGFCSIQKVTE